MIIPCKTGLLVLIMLVSFVKNAKCQEKHFTFSTGAAVNVSNFDWSIAGNLQGQSPNILSELHFNKITSLGIYLQGIYKPVKSVEAVVYYQRNNVVSGTGVDADYQKDNRISPTYNEAFLSNKGSLKIFETGVRYCFLEKGNLKLKTGVFYNSSIQNFYILNDDFDNLNSTYTGKWNSFLLEVVGSYRILEKLSITGSFLHGSVRYNSEADWNLIEIFEHPVSFRQHARGHSNEGKIKLDYMVNRLISLDLTGIVGRSRVNDGIDNSYLTNGNEISTKFNGSDNKYYGFRIGLGICF